MATRNILTVLAASLGPLCLFPGHLSAQVHRNSFETRELRWSKGDADASYQETVHDITDRAAHTGQFSEHIQITADNGSYIHYLYPSDRAAICDELNASVWIKSNRPGIRLMARLVLPRERDPNNLDARLTTTLRGDAYQLTGRWQRLELRRPVKLAKEQQQFMRADLKRDVDFTDAFIDRLILDLHDGPGLTEVWIDDVEVSPVQVDAVPTQQPRAIETKVTPDGPVAPVRPPRRPAVVELNQDQLFVSGQRFFFRGIRHSDTPLKALRDAGFNVIWVDYQTSPQLIEEAINLGFWLVPSLPATSADPRLASLGKLSHEVTRFLAGDAVLFWDLGGGLMEEQKDAVAMAARAVRFADPQKPIGADIWDGYRPYSRTLDLVGAHRWPLMTGLELKQYREWLEQRRLLARPGSFTWTWVQTHLPEWYTKLVYNREDTESMRGFEEPIGPQPEHIRLLSYIALSAGSHGLGFWSDRFLADTHQGRDRLLALGLLNLELQMLEPLLTTADQAKWIKTSVPDVKAAVMRTKHGVLALPMWLGAGGQFVPGQASVSQLKMVVPEVPIGAQAWLVTPADVRSLRSERVPGGYRVTVPEFGVAAAIVFTTDNSRTGLLVRFQDQAARMRQLAAQWAHDLAQVEIDKVERIETQLEQMGQTLPDGTTLMADARRRLAESERLWNNGLYRDAYAEAERALRPLRILMRGQWEKSLKGLDAPIASPYAVSFFTLPQHLRFVEEIKQTTPLANLVTDGGFELPPEQLALNWTSQETTLDEVTLSARRVDTGAQEGKQCLELKIEPRKNVDANGKPQPAPLALERTFLAINSPVVKLAPGTLVRISGWVNVPKKIGASVDGVLFYDSVGGEPLAIRLTEPTPWRRFTLYRRVPASGNINVTMALTGIGTAYFDDVRIEPLAPGNTTVSRPATTGLPVSRTIP
ncbi:MAG: hypothetical protein AB7K24_10315 [Gemmataceae bacterium]